MFGIARPPDHTHETLTALDIIKRIWAAFNSSYRLYVVATNLHQPSADMVVLTESGIGVIEMKHSYGQILIGQNGKWISGNIEITTGANNQYGSDPHLQVQSYTKQIRDSLIHPKSQPTWLSGRATDWVNYKFQTAACFTHQDADLDMIKKQVRQRKTREEPWETFSVLSPDDIVDWAMALSFERNIEVKSKLGQGRAFENCRLEKSELIRIVSQLMQATEWNDIYNLMPTGNPFGYLIALPRTPERTYNIGLDKDKTVIGRDFHACTIPIPNSYSLVSKIHLQIIRKVGGIFIEDLNSKNGTYLNGKKLDSTKRLLTGNLVTLGSPQYGDNIFSFEFKQELPNPPSTEVPSLLSKVD
jgi:hypothetical protein